MLKAKKEVNTALVARANSAMTIAIEVQKAVQHIIDNGGECSDEALAELQGWQAALEVKAENIGHVKVRLDGDIEYYKVVEEAARSRRKAAEGAQDRLKKYLRDAMITAGIKSIKGDLFSVSVVDGRERVEITDCGKLPFNLVDIVETIKPRLVDILSTLKAGGSVGGAALMRGEAYVMIRSGSAKENNDNEQ